MNTKSKVIGAVAAVVVAAGIGVPLAVLPGNAPKPLLTPSFGLPTPGTYITPPSTGGNLNCGADQTVALASYFNALPSDSTVTLPHDACYTISGSVKINTQNGLRINGNGATFNQWPPYCAAMSPFTATASATDGSTTLTLPGAGSAGITVGAHVAGAGITGSTNVTGISGDVVTILPASPGPLTLSSYTITCADSLVPMVFLADDQSTSISDLNLVGAWDGTSGTAGPCGCAHGDATEGKVGIMMQECTTCTLTGSSVIGTQGDGVSVQIPSEPYVSGTALNTNINVNDNVEQDCGWVCLTVESVNGLNFTFNTVNVAADAIDFEVDGASSGFTSPSSPIAFYAAEDNILIANNTFGAFGQDWFDDQQGSVVASMAFPCGFNNGRCSPSSCTGSTSCGITYFAVQQLNVSLNANKIKCTPSSGSLTCPIAQVSGILPGTLFDNRYLKKNITLSNNTITEGAGKSTSGGDPCTPDYGSTMTFNAVTNLTVSNNTMPLHVAPSGECGGPSPAALAAMKATNVQQMTLTGNSFLGGVGVLNTSSSLNSGTITQCGNTWGLTGSSNDGSCP